MLGRDGGGFVLGGGEVGRSEPSVYLARPLRLSTSKKNVAMGPKRRCRFVCSGLYAGGGPADTSQPRSATVRVPHDPPATLEVRFPKDQLGSILDRSPALKHI